MKLDNNLFDEKFDEIETKVDFLIERCQRLQSENHELLNRINVLEAELGKKDEIEDRFQDHKTHIQSKVDGLLMKLKEFSEITES